jgi:hypothetical protein
MKLNERSWSGHIISWIKEEINKGSTIFEEATNDEGLKVTGGKTRFPDVLVFKDKKAGVVFNGWELKFPDTPVDDREMLINALEKAQFLKSNSFVTWNGQQAIIWGITNDTYELNCLKKLKVYPASKNITSRSDVDNRTAYNKNEKELKDTLILLLSDLQSLYQDGTIKEAINISSDITKGIKNAGDYLIPAFQHQIEELKNTDSNFQNEYNKWKILEKATLNILQSSSRRKEQVVETQVLAKFLFYKLVGKVLFYQTLAKNLPQHISPISFTEASPIKEQLDSYFQTVREIDFQAVFDSDFTDSVPFDSTIDSVIKDLLDMVQMYDFRILPSEVIGTILENLVPPAEKQKFGQYFTPSVLSYLVSLSSIRTRNLIVYDPTSGTGSFLDAFYHIFKSLGLNDHQQLLNQIWGNDISHFPAVLSVINLYKQDVTQSMNFPRVTRKNYLSLSPESTVEFPDPTDESVLIQETIPHFDAIVSNFPFIQQEDIDNEQLSNQFQAEFGSTQPAFVRGNSFVLNERSDYFVYCFYHSLKFLNENGHLAAITSNAWLGKNYGLQFKKFILDNFSIKYVVRSKAEHWFHDSKVSTIFTTLKKEVSHTPSKFITINKKLDELTENLNNNQVIELFKNLYAEIDNCDLEGNDSWVIDEHFPKVYHKTDGTATVSIISKQHLINQTDSQENWSINFLAENPFEEFEAHLINPFPTHIDSGRGTRTGWDPLHILSQDEVNVNNIDNQFLTPYLKNSRDISSIKHTNTDDNHLFVCDVDETTLSQNYPNTFSWIDKFRTVTNKTGSPLHQKFTNEGRDLWYSLEPEESANIFISINPNARLFFAYSEQSISLNQRLIAIRVPENDVEFFAALFNSILSILTVELNGVSRSLGALDLNADFFKTKMKILNPVSISDEAKERIIEAFSEISERPQEDYDTEFDRDDRLNFDKVVFTEYGFDADFIPKLYNILKQTIKDRIEMKNR